MQGRLRLDGNDAGAQAAKGADTVADMGADIEHQVARPDELPIKRRHRAMAGRIAMIDPQ